MTNIGIGYRCVAVHDALSMVLCRVEKLLTNPEQVLVLLPLERDTGTYAGMYKQKISATKAIAKTLQKQLVRSWKSVEKAAMQVDFSLDPWARINAVGG